MEEKDKIIYSRLNIDNKINIPVLLVNRPEKHDSSTILGAKITFTYPNYNMYSKVILLVSDRYYDILIKPSILSPIPLRYNVFCITTQTLQYELRRTMISSMNYIEKSKTYRIELTYEYYNVIFGEYNPTRKRIPHSRRRDTNQ